MYYDGLGWRFEVKCIDLDKNGLMEKHLLEGNGPAKDILWVL